MDHRGGSARDIEVALYQLRARTTVHRANVPQIQPLPDTLATWRCSRG
jgi:hypothetical protein